MQLVRLGESMQFKKNYYEKSLKGSIMKRAFYDAKPPKYEAVGNGSYLYRWDIQEEVITNEMTSSSDENDEPSERVQYSCFEVVVWSPVTSNKITEAVISTICSASHEQKLVNEYNAANLGMVGGSKTSEEAKQRIAAYKEFLEYRAALKERVDADCSELGIK